LPEATVDGARRLLAVLDWPVAQLMALSLALVGNFDVAVSAWKAAGGTALRAGTDMLAAVGRASVRWELDEEAGDLAAASAGAKPVGAVAAMTAGPAPGDSGTPPGPSPTDSASDPA